MKSEWERLAYGSTHKTIYMPDIESLRVPLPPEEEQRRISSYLEVECSRIDRLRKLRTEQAAALAELEMSRISAALGGFGFVGGRLETGCTWLPSVPSAWAIERTSRFYRMDLGKMLDSQRESSAVAFDAPYLRNANVGWYRIDISDLSSMKFEPHEKSRYSVAAGDLLVCEGGAGVAEAAVWDGSVQPCYFQKSLHRVRSLSGTPVEWLMYWLRYAKHVGLFHADGNLSTIPHLTGEQLSEYRIPIPREPVAIVRDLEDELSEISQTRSIFASAEKLLGERRESLIAAAVSGQIDVTTASGVGV